MQFHERLGYKTSAGIRAGVVNIHHYPFHYHEDYMELICVLSGKITVYDSAVSYTLEKNELHLFNATDPHKIICTEKDCQILMVHIDKTKYLDKYDRLKLAYFVVHNSGKNQTNLPEMNLLRFLMARAYYAYTDHSASDIELDRIADEIIGLLFDQFHDYAYEKLDSGNYNIIRRKYDGRNENEFYRIYRIADYIESNISEKLKLTDIARMEYLSAPYLSKYIKENIGITFSELVSIARCSEAERLLANTNKGVEQIAYEVGFSNRGHLFTHFNRWFSKSPSKYRRMILEDLGENIKIECGSVDDQIIDQALQTYLNT